MEVDNDKTILRPRPGGRAAGAGDGDRTVIRPRPGGERAAIAAANADATVVQPRRRPSDVALRLKQAPGFGRNALIDAAGTLLSLTAQLVQVQGRLDVDRLNAEAVEQVKNFQRNAAAAGLEPRAVQKAGYLLCALVDETVLNTPWGEHSGWSQKTLLGRFYQQTSGGERVFVMIDEELGAVRKDYDLLELAYLCLSLGFEGKYRVDPAGKDTLERIRGEIYQVLRSARDNYRQELSPDARSSHHIRHRLHSFLPVWVAAAVLGLLGFGLFTSLQWDLNRRSDALQAEIAALVPAQRPTPAPEEASPPDDVVASNLRHALASELERGVLRLESHPNRVAIVLDAGELFGSGSADINESYQPILAKIARVLESTPGRVVVSGHTDSTPIRTPRYPSNWHLSLARASAVADYLAASANLQGRLVPEGRADAEPIADNQSAEGRARNRRVVLDVYYRRA